MELPAQNANLVLAAKLNKVAWVVTILVLFIVGMMRRTKIDVGIDFSFLPPFHATLNGLCAVFLLYAFWYIKRGNIVRHRQMIYIALGLSALFMLSYVTYHFTTEETTYCKEGLVRSVYFFFLISHIITAGFILPFILFTFIRAYTGQFEKHKRMARYVFPVWLYVAITGPICYLMLQPCYQ
jgi:putative membrane protein